MSATDDRFVAGPPGQHIIFPRTFGFTPRPRTRRVSDQKMVSSRPLPIPDAGLRGPHDELLAYQSLAIPHREEGSQ